MPSLTAPLEEALSSCVGKPIYHASGMDYRIALGFGDLYDDNYSYEGLVIIEAALSYRASGIRPTFSIRRIEPDDIPLYGNVGLAALKYIKGQILLSAAISPASGHTGDGIEFYFKSDRVVTPPDSAGSVLSLWPVIQKEPRDGSLLPVMRSDTGIWKVPT
jgi:hypothetical protein